MPKVITFVKTAGLQKGVHNTLNPKSAKFSQIKGAGRGVRDTLNDCWQYMRNAENQIPGCGNCCRTIIKIENISACKTVNV